ncbi:YbbR-like domain-containing protein [Fodinibius sp.]|uniref:CdaR family protein n=1 Tax=Fodinibius sp. TaxID=1872440 RepID=UPI002ACE3536|nr:CdaR family protein [Fodinibius sp.]MDZ7658895.1 CdaR family protein [Fodinibius sp.]
MEKSKIEEYKEKLLAAWESLLQKSNEDEIAHVGRERIIVFLVAFILALTLWLMVNLSRDYTLNIELPIQLGNVPAEKALVKDFPSTATVSVTGEGWKLINLYNNPPTINIDVSDAKVDLFDQVQQQMNAMLNINIQRVQPQNLTVQLGDRASKKVPVRSAVTVNFREQYGFLDPPTINPDSVTINGAATLIKNIEEWSTDSVQINNVAKDISQTVPLESSSELINLSHSEVGFEGEVVEYTEGEMQANITTRNLPPGRMVSYSPLAITIKYDVPIEEYTDVQDENPFDVYVSYQQILEDSTGFVTPQIEEKNERYHIRLRSFQPRRVAYFIVLDN